MRFCRTDVVSEREGLASLGSGPLLEILLMHFRRLCVQGETWRLLQGHGTKLLELNHGEPLPRTEGEEWVAVYSEPPPRHLSPPTHWSPTLFLSSTPFLCASSSVLPRSRWGQQVTWRVGVRQANTSCLLSLAMILCDSDPAVS